MELSQFTDYALRTLIYAAVREDEEGLCHVAEVAESYGISQHHLVKVVHRLGQLGYLETRRGRGGGFRLAQDPAGLTVGTVVRATEPLGLVDCLSDSTSAVPCAIDGLCGLKHAIANARGAFLSSLDGVTLADLVGRRDALARALSPPTQAATLST